MLALIIEAVLVVSVATWLIVGWNHEPDPEPLRRCSTSVLNEAGCSGPSSPLSHPPATRGPQNVNPAALGDHP